MPGSTPRTKSKEGFMLAERRTTSLITALSGYCVLTAVVGLLAFGAVLTPHLTLAAEEEQRTTLRWDDDAVSGLSVHAWTVPPEKEAWIEAAGGPVEAKRRIAERLTGWPSTRLSTIPKTDDENAFLTRIAQDTWRGLRAYTDRRNGLPLDKVSLPEHTLGMDNAEIGDYTSPTNIGLYLISIVGAEKLNLVTAEESVRLLNHTLSTIEALEKDDGLFFSFYDTTVSRPKNDFVPSIDNAWLAAGLTVVRSAKSEFGDRASHLLDNMEFDRFLDPRVTLLSHGYSAASKLPEGHHYGLLYTEARIASLIAIGKGDVPQKHWFKLARTLDPEAVPQQQIPEGRTIKRVGDFQVVGGYYQVGDLRIVPSWGGSLFEALMPTLVIDENRYAPESLGANSLVHTDVHRTYALESLGYLVWGLSPSTAFGPRGYGEFGVPILGTRGYGDGVVTPHASALALATRPADAVANFRQLADSFPIYGDFGFYDAVDPNSGQVAYTHLALDQAMIFIAITNRLTDGAIQRAFAADAIGRRALSILGPERFFE
jgi:hypothetical protein